MIADEPSDFYPSRQVMDKFTRNRASNVLDLHRMLGRSHSPGFGINLGCHRLGNVMEQSREDEHGFLVTAEQRPLLKLKQLPQNQPGVGPNVSLGVPLGILSACGHRPTPRLK